MDMGGSGRFIFQTGAIPLKSLLGGNVLGELE